MTSFACIVSFLAAKNPKKRKRPIGDGHVHHPADLDGLLDVRDVRDVRLDVARDARPDGACHREAEARHDEPADGVDAVSDAHDDDANAEAEAEAEDTRCRPRLY